MANPRVIPGWESTMRALERKPLISEGTFPTIPASVLSIIFMPFMVFSGKPETWLPTDICR